MYVCPRCGAEVAEQALFCKQCGEPFVQQSEPAAAEAVAATAVAVPLPDRQDGHELPIPENIAAVISYITIIPATVFLLVEPFRRNEFVRFHSFQSIFMFVAAVASAMAAVVLWMVLRLIPFMRVLVFPFAGLIGLAWFFLWVLLVVKAYHHVFFKLPYLGDLVERRMHR